MGSVKGVVIPRGGVCIKGWGFQSSGIAKRAEAPKEVDLIKVVGSRGGGALKG